MMFRFLSSILILTGLLHAAPIQPATTPEGARELQDRVGKLYNPLVEATVAIFADGVNGAGSGVIISADGLVMTAAHVLGKPGTRLHFLLADGSVATGVALGVDHNTDSGLAHLDGAGPFPFRPAAKTGDYAEGDWVLATGHPGGPVIGRPAPLRLGRVIKAGKTSGFDDPIITDCTVISGDSGGPLFNLDGEVIGINSNISFPWSNNQHVPIDAFLGCWQELLNGKSGTKEAPEATEHSEKSATADEFLRAMTGKHRDLLEKHRDDPSAAAQLDRPTLLFPHEMQRDFDRWASDPDARRSASLGLRFDPAQRLPIITQVLPDSPAARAGINPGDKILAVAGKDGLTLVELVRLLDTTAPDTALSLKVGRGSQTLDLSVTAGSRIARHDFGSTTFGLLAQIPLQAAKAEASKAGRAAPEVTEGFASFTAPAARSVVTILREGKKVALGTVIDADGSIVTKASEVGTEGDLVCRVGDAERPLVRIGFDQATDIALFRAEPTGLAPVVWADGTVQPGRLLFGAGPGGQFRTMGTVCRPPAPCPADGFEFPASANTPPSLGVTLDPDVDLPTVQTVLSGGAADRAGILEGDLIAAIDGTAVATIEELHKAIGAYAPGTKISINVRRGNEELKLPVILDKPAVDETKPSSMARARDAQIEGLSSKGGKLNPRRRDFPLCIFNDTLLNSDECGGPLLDTEGKAMGIDIARTLRTRSLAIPSAEVQSAVTRIRATAK